MFELSTHQTQKSEIIKRGRFYQIIQPTISSLQDLYYVCYGNQCQNQTKNQLHKNYLVFNEKEPSE